MVDRVSTIGMHNDLLKDISATRNDLAILQGQISSGKQARDFPSLSMNTSIEKVVDFQSQFSRIESYVNANKTAILRLQAVNQSLDQLQEIAGEVRNLIIAKRDPATGPSLPLQEVMDGKLGSIQNNLNAKAGGRFVFAGSRADAPPVPNITQTNLINDKATDSYFVGDNVNLKVQANDSLEVSYGVTAGNQAFIDMIGAIYTALDGEAADSDAKYVEAIDMINNSISQLGEVKANAINNMIVLEETNIAHTDARVFLDNLINQETETDIPSASIDLALNETILTASFQVFARLSQLNLMEFL